MKPKDIAETVDRSFLGWVFSGPIGYPLQNQLILQVKLPDLVMRQFSIYIDRYGNENNTIQSKQKICSVHSDFWPIRQWHLVAPHPLIPAFFCNAKLLVNLCNVVLFLHSGRWVFTPFLDVSSAVFFSDKFYTEWMVVTLLRNKWNTLKYHNNACLPLVPVLHPEKTGVYLGGVYKIAVEQSLNACIGASVYRHQLFSRRWNCSPQRGALNTGHTSTNSQTVSCWIAEEGPGCSPKYQSSCLRLRFAWLCLSQQVKKDLSSAESMRIVSVGSQSRQTNLKILKCSSQKKMFVGHKYRAP